jgi:hypothetical protein
MSWSWLLHKFMTFVSTAIVWFLPMLLNWTYVNCTLIHFLYYHTNIICVTWAVRGNTSQSIVSTAFKWGLCPYTLHVPQPYFPRPLSKPPISYSFRKTKLSTCNLGIRHIPGITIIITHCSPLSIVEICGRLRYNTGNTWTCSIRMKSCK